jgi:hypothetical protein
LIQIPDDRNYVRRGLDEERENMRIRTIAGAKVVDVQATTAPVHPSKQRRGGGGFRGCTLKNFDRKGVTCNEEARRLAGAGECQQRGRIRS